jgi:hypothetical protein
MLTHFKYMSTSFEPVLDEEILQMEITPNSMGPGKTKEHLPKSS